MNSWYYTFLKVHSCPKYFGLGDSNVDTQVHIIIENFIIYITQQFNKGIFTEINRRSDFCDFDIHFPTSVVKNIRLGQIGRLVVGDDQTFMNFSD